MKNNFYIMSNDKFDVLLELVKEQGNEMRRGFELIDKRFEQIDKRFEQIDKRFDKIEGELRDIRNEFIKPLQRGEKIKYFQLTGAWSVASMIFGAIGGFISSIFFAPMTNAIHK